MFQLTEPYFNEAIFSAVVQMRQSLMPSHCTSGAGVVHKFFPLQTLQLFFAGALDELLERLKRLPDVSPRTTYLCVMGGMMRFDQAHTTAHADVTARYQQP